MRGVSAAIVLALAVTSATVTSVHSQAATPGETSGAPLAPLVVTGIDPDDGSLSLSYQTGCGTVDNNIYYGPLDQVATLGWTGEVCGIGRTGSFHGFNPGPGSWFFVMVGNDGQKEGSYGKADLPGGSQPERRPFTGNACGVFQSLTHPCSPVMAGQACSSSAECGARQGCVMGSGSTAACGCLPPFAGAFCEQCAPGYEGPDCRSCSPGYVSNAMQNASGDDLPEDLTNPEQFLCLPDMPASCLGRSCSGHGLCRVDGRDAVCACDPGYAGADCDECAANYERNTAGVCVLGQACREGKCGGHGSCSAAPFGEIACVCDAGFSGVDCGGPDLFIRNTGDRQTLYDQETIVVVNGGGNPPFTWRVTGPALITPCGSSTPSCPPGGATLTIVAPRGGIQNLLHVQVTLQDGVGHNAALDFAALPSSFLPFTGDVRLELFPYYEAMLRYMRARGIRAGILGISKGGVLLGTNGYGYRDAGIDADPFVNAGEGPGPLVQPLSPFRIASVSKTLSAAAVRQTAASLGVDITSSSLFNRAATWIQESINFSLTSGAPPFDYNLPAPLTTDSRWANVTIQHLMNHHAGFFRDVVPASTTGQPLYNDSFLPFTEELGDPSQLQTAKSGTSSDISYATSYALAALQLQFDPRITVENMIKFSAGMQLHYNPGGSTAGGDNYSNLGYIMLGRVMEGLKGTPYDPDEPGVPMGWGAFPKHLQQYLCETSGITGGIHPGDAFSPQPLEPYYRSLDWQGVEGRAWNLAEGADKIRWNAGIQQWQFCQSDCPDLPGAVWNDEENTPTAYGGFWLAERNSAGGIVATAPALLKFARNHRIKAGSPGDGASGIGSLLAAPGAYGSSSSHNGSLSGTRSWLWQMGGFRTNNIPFDSQAWNDDPSAPLDLDPNGAVLVNEGTVGFGCNLPSDVAVAVVFNQREDRRAPNSNVSSQSGSSNGTVYGRIIDYLGDATCKVAQQGWPVLGAPNAIVQAPPVCN
jgi:hypothetical protein